MYHAGVKQTINGHSPRFLQVSFALNARVSRSPHLMILRTQAENKVFPQSAVFFIKLVQFSNRPFSGIELLLTIR